MKTLMIIVNNELETHATTPVITLTGAIFSPGVRVRASEHPGRQ